MESYIEIIVGLLIAIILVINTVMDISRREISICLTLGVTLAGLIIILVSGKRSIIELALGLIPGLFIILISILSKGKVGMGDGIIVASMGLLWGLEATFSALLMGTLLSGLMSVFMLVIKKWKTSTRLPFVPFLCGASGILAILQVSGL